MASTSRSKLQATEGRRVLIIEPFPKPNANSKELFDSRVWAVSHADDNELGRGWPDLRSLI